MPGKPVDRLLAAYALVSASALVFPHRTEAWPWLLALHVVAIFVGFGTRPVRHVWAAAAQRWPRTLGIVADAYVLPLIPFLYAELPALNLAVWNGRYFDSIIIAVESALFGGQPSREWAAAMPWPPLSEALHAAYLSYYLLIFVPPILIWILAGRDAFRTAVFALMLTFVVHYLFFVWFPVQGPRYLFPPPDGALANGPVYRLTHVLLEAGSSRGTAFPSSHVGVAVTQTIMIFRFVRPAAPIVGMLAIGLACGAVYGGFHYATDVIAGALLGGSAALASPALYRRLAR